MRGASGPDVLATDVPLDPDFLKANPWAQTFYDLAPDSRSGLIEGHEAETSQIMRPIMEAVERVLTQNTDPKQELAQVQQQLDSKFG
jgi:multiple sugar transport system substrate-binding protein